MGSEDLREAIIQREYKKLSYQPYETSIIGNIEKDVIFNAMDIYFTERSMELLEYMAKNQIECCTDENEDATFWNGISKDTLTKEQLFENFL